MFFSSFIERRGIWILSQLDGMLPHIVRPGTQQTFEALQLIGKQDSHGFFKTGQIAIQCGHEIIGTFLGPGRSVRSRSSCAHSSLPKACRLIRLAESWTHKKRPLK